MEVIWVRRQAITSEKQNYFFITDCTAQITLIRLNKSGFRKTPAGGPEAARGRIRVPDRLDPGQGGCHALAA
jgi:hypothetical protein